VGLVNKPLFAFFQQHCKFIYLSGISPNPIVELIICRNKPDIESSTLTGLLRPEHPVDYQKEFPRSRDDRLLLAPPSRDLRVEHRESRAWFAMNMSVDRLCQHPAEMAGPALADGVVVDGRCRLPHSRHQPRISAQLNASGGQWDHEGPDGTVGTWWSWLLYPFQTEKLEFYPSEGVVQHVVQWNLSEEKGKKFDGDGEGWDRLIASRSWSAKTSAGKACST
jgi:hypothetical protein